jgi:2-polyprenyl-6-methoxyphenol hydroxylase-like FAD-dependent oxidoreductase
MSFGQRSRQRTGGLVAVIGAGQSGLAAARVLHDHNVDAVVYLGPEHQRSFASNTLRGVSADANAVIAPLVAWIRDALAPSASPPRRHTPGPPLTLAGQLTVVRPLAERLLHEETGQLTGVVSRAPIRSNTAGSRR